MDDPGWRDSWRGLPFALSPLFFIRRAGTRKILPILIFRRMYVSFAAMQVLVGVIGGLLITDPRPGADSEIPDLVFVGGIVAIAVASYLFVTTQVRKQLAGAAREGSLLGTYRSAFFLGMAFTTGTAVTGWIVSFNTYEPLFTALAIAASLPLSIWLAPTASHLRQIDEDARTNGATTSLREALYAPPES